MSAVVAFDVGDAASPSTIARDENAALFDIEWADNGTFTGCAAVASAESGDRRWWTLACLSGHSE